MSHPLKKALKNANMKFKWGGQGNAFVYYKTPEMKVFRMFDSDKDGARIAKDLQDADEFAYTDIHDVSMQVAWTWDNQAKENDYGVTDARPTDIRTGFPGR